MPCFQSRNVKFARHRLRQLFGLEKPEPGTLDSGTGAALVAGFDSFPERPVPGHHSFVLDFFVRAVQLLSG